MVWGGVFQAGVRRNFRRMKAYMWTVLWLGHEEAKEPVVGKLGAVVSIRQPGD